jgi:hypothetical protein
MKLFRWESHPSQMSRIAFVTLAESRSQAEANFSREGEEDLSEGTIEEFDLTDGLVLTFFS